MKFGETIWQRSVPRWRSYNIDYGHIKSLIKEHTAPAQAGPIAIPGKADVVASKFEDQLLVAIALEHSRLTLFVKSKYYEINSRLGSVERQLHEVQKRASALNQASSSVNLRRKFSRIESEILRVGEEIQNLSRFITINRLAIRKLLKKYRKWSGSTTLAAKVDAQVFNQPGSFTKSQLQPALDLYVAYLDAVRSPFFQPELNGRDVQENPTKLDPLHPTVLNLLQGSVLEFDIAMSMGPPGSQTEQAAYWVHQDNIVELRVLLMQFMRNLRPSYSSTTPAASESSTPPSSVRSRHLSTGDRINTVVIDNPDLVAQSLSSSKRPSWRPAALSSWATSGKAVVATNDSETTVGGLLVAKLRRGVLASFVDTESPFPPPSHEIDTDDEDDQSPPQVDVRKDFALVRQRLAQLSHSDPLVRVFRQRSRFFGLENRDAEGVWATLDEEISMEATSTVAVKQRNYFSSTAGCETSFPYAVLTVRTEGSHEVGFIHKLDQSHLTERVQGFSLEAHATLTFHRPADLHRTSWSRKLDQDIRHIPQGEDSRRHSSSYDQSSSTLTPKNEERSAASLSDDLMPVRGSKRATLRIPQSGTIVAQQSQFRTVEQPQQRYWNEYDYPEDEDDGEGFVIYVDPDASDFPGQKMLQGFGSRMRRFFVPTRHREPNTQVEGGLLSVSPPDSTGLPSTLLGSSSDDDSDHATVSKPRRKRKSLFSTRRTQHGPFNYGTLDGALIATPNDPDMPVHTTTVPLCLLAAGIILAIVMVLMATSRRKWRSEVQAVTVAGVAASLAFTGIAVCVWVHGRLVGMRHSRLRDRARRRVMGIGREELAIMFGAVIAVGLCVGDVWVLVDAVR